MSMRASAKVELSDYETSPFTQSYQIAGEHRVCLSEIKEQFETWWVKNRFTEAMTSWLLSSRNVVLVAALFTISSLAAVSSASSNPSV